MSNHKLSRKYSSGINGWIRASVAGRRERVRDLSTESSCEILPGTHTFIVTYIHFIKFELLLMLTSFNVVWVFSMSFPIYVSYIIFHSFKSSFATLVKLSITHFKWDFVFSPGLIFPCNPLPFSAIPTSLLV